MGCKDKEVHRVILVVLVHEEPKEPRVTMVEQVTKVE